MDIKIQITMDKYNLNFMINNYQITNKNALK